MAPDAWQLLGLFVKFGLAMPAVMQCTQKRVAMRVRLVSCRSGCCCSFLAVLATTDASSNFCQGVNTTAAVCEPTAGEGALGADDGVVVVGWVVFDGFGRGFGAVMGGGAGFWHRSATLTSLVVDAVASSRPMRLCQHGMGPASSASPTCTLMTASVVVNMATKMRLAHNTRLYSGCLTSTPRNKYNTHAHAAIALHAHPPYSWSPLAQAAPATPATVAPNGQSHQLPAIELVEEVESAMPTVAAWHSEMPGTIQTQVMFVKRCCKGVYNQADGIGRSGPNP